MIHSFHQCKNKQTNNMIEGMYLYLVGSGGLLDPGVIVLVSAVDVLMTLEDDRNNIM